MRCKNITPVVGMMALDTTGNMYEVIAHDPDAKVRNMSIKGMVTLRNNTTGVQIDVPARLLGFCMCWIPETVNNATQEDVA